MNINRRLATYMYMTSRYAGENDDGEQHSTRAAGKQLEIS